MSLPLPEFNIYCIESHYQEASYESPYSSFQLSVSGITDKLTTPRNDSCTIYYGGGKLWSLTKIVCLVVVVP